MSRYKWLVFTNCAEGQDADFNRWYDETHLPDLLRIPGIVAANRSTLDPAQLVVLDSGMELSTPQGVGAKFRYLAVYEFDTENPSAVIQEVIARAGNRTLRDKDPTAHAELLAIRAAAAAIGSERLTECDLHVTLEPCTMCAGAMVHARVERPVFGAREPRAGVVCSTCALLDELRFNHRVVWQEGVLAEDSGRLLLAFFQARR